MAKKKQLSLLQQQKAKLKKQRALTANPKTRQLLSRKIQQVQVRIVNTQKALTGSKPAKALPPGRTTPTGRPSARRAEAAAKKTRAAQGTKGTAVRKGQPNRGYRAAQSAGSRALRRTAARTTGRGGLAGLAMTAASLAARQGLLGKKVQTSIKQDDARMDRFLQNPLKKDTTNERKPSSSKSKSNYPTKANLVTRKASRDYQAEAKSKATSTPKTKSSPKPKAKPDNRSTLTKEIDGLTKFLDTHKGKKGMERALTQARKSLAAKKKKRSQRSSTMSGTLPSNRNSA